MVEQAEDLHAVPRPVHDLPPCVPNGAAGVDHVPDRAHRPCRRRVSSPSAGRRRPHPEDAAKDQPVGKMGEDHRSRSPRSVTLGRRQDSHSWYPAAIAHDPDAAGEGEGRRHRPPLEAQPFMQPAVERAGRHPEAGMGGGRQSVRASLGSAHSGGLEGSLRYVLGRLAAHEAQLLSGDHDPAHAEGRHAPGCSPTRPRSSHRSDATHFVGRIFALPVEPGLAGRSEAPMRARAGDRSHGPGSVGPAFAARGTSGGARWPVQPQPAPLRTGRGRCRSAPSGLPLRRGSSRRTPSRRERGLGQGGRGGGGQLAGLRPGVEHLENVRRARVMRRAAAWSSV